MPIEKDTSKTTLDCIIENSLKGLKNDFFDVGIKSFVYKKSTYLKLSVSADVKTKCPVNGADDTIKVSIYYEPNIHHELIEHLSLIRWLDSFKDKPFGLEATCNIIYEEIAKKVNPITLKVTAKTHSNYFLFYEASRENTW